MIILSREEMYFIDKYTIEKIGIPGKILMENAGKGCSESIREKFLKPGFKIAVFCGDGNNGGDGFVIARYLKKWGYFPTIFLVGNPDKMSSETSENYHSCLDLNIETHQFNDFEQWKNFDISLSYFDILIDAIFGIGFKGTVKGWIADLIKDINSSNIKTIAVDIASGIDADTGQGKIAIKADHTYTMAAYKYGHFLEKGRQNSGFVEVIDIGVPAKIYHKFPPKAKLVTTKNVKYPKRSPFSHKGDYGKVGIIAGSPGFSGAAIMAARAALRAGAGLITLFHPKGMELIFETQLLEVMTYSIPEDEKGIILFDEFWEKLSTMDVLLLGPGIGTSETTTEFLKIILDKWEKPVVIDADGLNILASDSRILNLVSGKPIILTPHIGEFSRLANKDISEILKHPLKELEDFTKKLKTNVLLKSATSIFADDSNLIFDISGNDGLSTGGSGDVLAGIMVSFLGQKLALKDAAISASFLLGKTAERLSKIRKTASIIPSDIIEEIFKY